MSVGDTHVQSLAPANFTASRDPRTSGDREERGIPSQCLSHGLSHNTHLSRRLIIQQSVLLQSCDARSKDPFESKSSE